MGYDKKERKKKIRKEEYGRGAWKSPVADLA